MLFSKTDLRRLIIPLIIEQFLSVAMGFIDTAMVSGAGTAAVSGVSLSDNINVLLINIFAALATGGAVVVAQYLGRKEKENAGTAAKQLLYASFAISMVIVVIIFPIRQWVLYKVFGNAEPLVMEHASTYFSITILSFPFLALYNSSAAIMRTIGNSKTPTFTALLMNIVNIIGNAVLIYGLKMNVAGAAISTVLCRAAGAIAMLWILKRPNPMLQIKNLFKPIWRGDMVKRILRIGVPNGVENSLFQLGKIIILQLVSSLSTVVIAANSVANILASIVTIPGSAIGLSMVTVVGRTVGAKEYKQAKDYTKLLLKLAYISLVITSIVVAILLPFILSGAFHLEGEGYIITRNLAYSYIIVAILIWPISFGLPNALRAAGDAQYTMVVSLICMALFRVVFSYILVNGFNMGIYGVWIAMYIDWAARSILFYIRFKNEKWTKKQVI